MSNFGPMSVYESVEILQFSCLLRWWDDPFHVRDESWHDFLFSQLNCHPLWWSKLKASTCGMKQYPDKREHSLLTLQGSRHHPPRRLVFSNPQKPFLIWPTLGWHIPEPKCSHKRLSLVAKLFTPEWLLLGAVGHSQLDYADKEKGLWYIISTPFRFRNACFDPLALRKPTLPFLLSKGLPAYPHPSFSFHKYWLMFLETGYHH